MLLKTGKWFHGKETKKHNPTKEIEFHLLTTPSSTSNVGIKTNPKIVKTGFPASSITKAQLGEQAEERRKQQQQQQQFQKNQQPSVNTKTKIEKQLQNNTSVSRTSSSSSDNSETGSSLLYRQGSGNKKHVTFEQINSSENDTNSFNEFNNKDFLTAISDIPVDDPAVKVS